VQPPHCKNDIQKFLGKLNYLRRFIVNLSGKISVFAPILRLKNKADITWGGGGQISNAPLMTSKGTCLRLYIAAEDVVIGAVLMQMDEGKECIITYFSRHLMDVETKYSFIKKLCLSLFYVCSKLRHYL
jgi:hypothetical protein